jgi:hypothetical protein
MKNQALGWRLAADSFNLFFIKFKKNIYFVSSCLRVGRIFCILLLAVALNGCGPIGRYGLQRETGTQAEPEEAIRNAHHYLVNNPNWNTDCSHFVLACYHSPKMTSFLNSRKYSHNLTYDLNYYLTQKKTRRARAALIQPGDILIFSKTYDVNRDGRIDDKDVYTHTGIVESFKNWVVIYIDASQSRKSPRLRRRQFSFYGEKYNERVATDPATGRQIRARETFYAAYAVPPEN